MPSKECLNPGMIWASRTGRSRCSWQDAEDVWSWTVEAPTWNLGACMLIWVEGAPNVKYMLLEPESAMADSGVAVGRMGLK